MRIKSETEGRGEGCIRWLKKNYAQKKNQGKVESLYILYALHCKLKVKQHLETNVTACYLLDAIKRQ